ncbi:phage terminase small subunit P27 family [Vagococcus fluvialis]|uniref:phage terminase small subunit P27 family n=1 Tax=Vagococcus fluvialis TaxID=2738 RepID=UPI0014331098|nr:phage terminase small subunit P27 family [Vagococcus fluvialis]NKC58963.1 phage terminase small subunit P27 family [Vagococcus fluvialis]NKD49718.1 phage terminase small subunit P27 family [Vagococcus fluvialis]
MTKPVKLFEGTKAHLSLEERSQREDAKEELFNHEELSTQPPDWLPQSAISEWDRLVPVMKKDFPLSETDYGLLISYCLAFSRIKTAEGEIRKTGTFITNENTGTKQANPAIRVQSQAMKDLKASASALGMTLEARSKLALNKAKNEKPVDEFEELLNDD